MTMMTFQSVFAKQLGAYVKLRRGLGFFFEQQEELLKAFDRHISQMGYDGPLTQELALGFATTNPHNATIRCAQRYQAVRHFSEYLTSYAPGTPILDPRALRCRNAGPPAHIFTAEELARILHEARHISTKNPMRGVTFHAMVGLAASTGLRISEVVRLDKADVDLATGTLIVRRTKFKKDRLVPLHATTLEVMRNYAAARDVTFPECDDLAFFINMKRRRFCRNTVQQAFCKIARRAGLRGQKGKGPSFHSLRHSFAVMRLVAWYKAGVDVHSMLPALATYMGHVHYTSTAYYLTATAELLGHAVERLHNSVQQAEVPT